MREEERLKEIIDRAAHLEASQPLSADQLRQVGRELGIDPAHVDKARKQVEQEERASRWRSRKRRVLVLLAVAMVVVIGATAGLVGLGVHLLRDDLTPDFERQIELVDDAEPYLSGENREAFDELIERYRAANDTDEKLQLMARINEGLRKAVFFAARHGDARSAGILQENQRLSSRFFFASH